MVVHHPPFPFFSAKFNYLSLSLSLHHRIHPLLSTWVIKLHSSLIANIANGYIDLMAVKMSCLEYHQHLQLLLLQDCPLVVDNFQALLSFFFFSLPLSLLYNIISFRVCVLKVDLMAHYLYRLLSNFHPPTYYQSSSFTWAFVMRCFEERRTRRKTRSSDKSEHESVYLR